VTLESLVIEWRDARETILRADWSNPVTAKANVHLWTRLGHAEAALMARARAMQPVIPPGPHEDGLIDGDVREGVAYPTVWTPPASQQHLEVIIDRVPKAKEP